jgi:hypothetical protein
LKGLLLVEKDEGEEEEEEEKEEREIPARAEEGGRGMLGW